VPAMRPAMGNIWVMVATAEVRPCEHVARVFAAEVAVTTHAVRELDLGNLRVA
jgi:hypothetical protein